MRGIRSISRNVAAGRRHISYAAPVRDMKFVLFDVLEADKGTSVGLCVSSLCGRLCFGLGARQPKRRIFHFLLSS